MRLRHKLDGQQENTYKLRRGESRIGNRGPCFVVGLACASIALLGQPVSALAAVHGDAELLRAVAMQNKANNEAILTWKGNVIIHDSAKRTDGYDREVERKASFAFGRVEDAVRWCMDTSVVRCIVEGKSVPDPEAGYYGGMLKDDRYYNYKIYEKEKPYKWHHLVIFDKKRATGEMFALNFDPTYFLKHHGADIPERLMFLYKEANNPKLHDWSVTRDGNLVTVETRPDGNVNRYVFDLSKGGSMVSYYGKDAKDEEKWTYDFEKKGEVWVLKAVDQTHEYAMSAGVKVSSRKRVEWIDNIVNESLDPDEFTFDKLGVKPGDLVHDTLSGVVFRYKEESSSVPREVNTDSSAGGPARRQNTDAARGGEGSVGMVGKQESPGGRQMSSEIGKRWYAHSLGIVATLCVVAVLCGLSVKFVRKLWGKVEKNGPSINKTSY